MKAIVPLFLLAALVSVQAGALPSQPPSACVATSMFYLLKVSDSPMLSTALQSLPGATDAQRLNHLNEIAIEIQGEPKDLFMGLDFTKKEDFANEVMSSLSLQDVSFQLLPLQRDSSEVLPGQFPNRLFGLLKNSLDQGAPVIAGLRFQLDSGGSVGHTVLITAVQRLENSKDFEIEFLNPIDGRAHRLLVNEELEQNFEAYIFDKESLSPRWSEDHLFVLNGSQMISSPFLKLKGQIHMNFGLSDETEGSAYLEEILLIRN